MPTEHQLLAALAPFVALNYLNEVQNWAVSHVRLPSLAGAANAGLYGAVMGADGLAIASSIHHPNLLPTRK